MLNRYICAVAQLLIIHPVMNDFLAARSQMALSLGFHIIYSCIGMVMPVFMAVSNYKWIKTGNPVYKNITQAWSKGVAIFFATGAVSGTMLSFELGLLWPKFMAHAGPIFGMPFSLEGVAFFIEAIALGFFLYGWDRFNKWFHWCTGVVVGISGVVSGILVVSANSWMNSPAGFDYVNGQYINIDPIKAMFNAAWFSEALHMTIAHEMRGNIPPIHDEIRRFTDFRVRGSHRFCVTIAECVAHSRGADERRIADDEICLRPFGGTRVYII